MRGDDMNEWMDDLQAESDALLRSSDEDKWKAGAEEIEVLYRRMADLGADEANRPERDMILGELIMKLDDRCKGVVWKQFKDRLSAKGITVTEDDYFNVTAEVHLALCKPDLIGRYETNDNYKRFADYCIGIYRFKAIDYCNSLLKGRLDPSLDDEENLLATRLVDYKAPVAHLEHDPLERILDMYVQSIMQSKKNRFHVMLYCFSKVLPIILGQTGADSSDKWAWIQMKDKDMKVLSDEFVYFYNNVMSYLEAHWSDYHWQQLAKPYKET